MAKIKEDITENTEVKENSTENTEVKSVDYWDEKVQVTIPRPADEKFGAARTITLNGKNYQIQYDIPVFVPRKVAAIIEESRLNQNAVDKRIANMQKDQFLGEF